MLKKFPFRKILFWTHLVLGLTAGGVIAVVAFTGATMAFEKQVIAWAERDLRRVAPPAPDTPRLPLATILAQLRTSHPDVRPASVVVSADPTEPLTLALGRTGSLYVNPYTGAATPSGAKEVRAFFRLMLTWHRWLGVPSPPRTQEIPHVGGVPPPRTESARPETDDHDHGPTANSSFTARQFASSVVGAACIIFLTLCLSGLYLWWPRTWNLRSLRATSLFNSKLRGKARDWNWHNVLGLWSAPLLIVITFTGLVMAYRPFAAWLYPRPADQAAAGPGGPAVTVPFPPPGTALLTPDALLARAQKEIPAWDTITLRLATAEGRGRGGRGSAGRRPATPSTNPAPGEPRAPQTHPAASLSIRASTSWLHTPTTLQLDPYTGAVLRRSSVSDLPFPQAMRSLNRTLHTGEAFGLVGQTLAFLACLGGLVLVYTGFALSSRRFFKRSASRAAAPQSAVARPSLSSALPEPTSTPAPAASHIS